jgi:crossover junction endodeoxyribonuclease RusA
MAGAMKAHMEIIDTDPRHVTFVVVGKPEPAGSKRAFPIKRAGGRIGVSVTDANPKTKPWQAAVAAKASEVMGTDPLLDGPLGMAITFHLRRPKGHYGAHGVRARAPRFPVVRPDCTKLVRAVEDACTGVVWADDAQVVEQLVTKRYAEPEGAHVQIWKL